MYVCMYVCVCVCVCACVRASMYGTCSSEILYILSQNLLYHFILSVK
jgi:hypothetical protein